MHGADFFASVEFQMSLLLFVALSGYVLASFISQPAVLADISTFTLDLLYFLLALSIVAILSKLIGCGIPAKLAGMSNRDSLIIGLGMSPRGEVAMIVALLVLQQNIIQQPGFVAIILMSLITTLIVPMLLRQLIKTSTT